MYVKVTLMLSVVVLFLLINVVTTDNVNAQPPPPLEHQESDLELAETRPQVRFCYSKKKKILKFK